MDRVEAWVPVFLFSVLFALSMDYHVFLLTRIRERYAQTGDTVDAVVHGIAATGRIITGAALIIVVVFAGFATGRSGDVPADGLRRRCRTAGGRHPDPDGHRPRGHDPARRWNWYLPSWLNWLPELHVEGDQPTGTVPEPQPASMR